MAMPLLRLGTRGSPLALRQTEMVRDALAASDPALAVPGAIEVVTIRTTGDRVQDRRLAEIGGKGLFVREIERALAEGGIDAAVHSLKDMETVLDPRFAIAAVPPREDPRDAFVSPHAATLAALRPGAAVGTSSVRRQAQVLHCRPDLRVVMLRGNVGTRLARIAAGEADATLLAVAGLARLGMLDRASEILSPETVLPAVAQGAIAVECRADDAATRARLARIDHPPSAVRVTAERGLLAALDGSCNTPIAALARMDGDRLQLAARLFRPDGSRLWTVARDGLAADAERIGRDAGAELRSLGDPDLFA